MGISATHCCHSYWAGNLQADMEIKLKLLWTRQKRYRQSSWNSFLGRIDTFQKSRTWSVHFQLQITFCNNQLTTVPLLGSGKLAWSESLKLSLTLQWQFCRLNADHTCWYSNWTKYMQLEVLVKRLKASALLQGWFSFYVLVWNLSMLWSCEFAKSLWWRWGVGREILTRCTQPSVHSSNWKGNKL